MGSPENTLTQNPAPQEQAADPAAAKLPGTEPAKPDLQKEQREIQTLKAEFNNVVRTEVENHMHVNFLRNDAERNKIIDNVYLAYLHPDRLIGKGLAEIKELLEQAKKLGSLGKLMEGQRPRSEEYCTLDAYLARFPENERDKRKAEYYLSDASISEQMLKDYKKLRELTPATGAMTPDALVAKLKEHGITDREILITAVAVAFAESGLNPMSRLHTSVEDSRGVYQINTDVHQWDDLICVAGADKKEAFRNSMYDIDANIEAMKKLGGDRGNWSAWSAYNNGSYRKYIAAATAAVDRAG